MSRNRLDILAEIMQIAGKGTTKTRLISQANLNQKIVKHSLTLLVNLGLLAERCNSPLSYSTTDKGLQFLQEYRRMQKLLDSELELKESF
jgi:predicted transcriptional regulator